MRSFCLILLLVSSCLFIVGCKGAEPADDGLPEQDPTIENDLVFSPAGRTFNGSISVEIQTSITNATIYYTLDGTRPNPPEGVGTVYDGAIEITDTSWLRVSVMDGAGETSPITSENYIEVDNDVAGFDSNLPLIFIDSFGYDVDDDAWDTDELGPRPYRPVMSVFIDVDVTGRAGAVGEPNFAGYGGMHVRGSSSAGEYPKKQYKFETWDEDDEDQSEEILGFPKESDWVIHAPFSDKTLMRNYLMYTWSRDIDRYAVRTKFAEVFIAADGGPVTISDYRGVYVFMEKIKRDSDRVNVAKMTSDMTSEPDISGGYILAKDWYEDSESFETQFMTEIYEDEINFVYPKPDKINSQQRDWITDYTNSFESTLSGEDFDDPDTGYAAYIDVDSFVDHMLLVEMGRNVDGYVLSTYMHKDREGKLNMGPIWDYNGALGNADYFCCFLTDGWHYNFDETQCSDEPEGETFPADNPGAFKWYDRLLQDPAFVQLRADRWAELRQNEFSTTNLMQAIDDNAATLEEAQARNFERWPIFGELIWPNDEGAEDRQTYAEEIDYLKTWLQGRVEWLDGAV